MSQIPGCYVSDLPKLASSDDSAPPGAGATPGLAIDYFPSTTSLQLPTPVRSGPAPPATPRILSTEELYDEVSKVYEVAFKDIPGQKKSIQWVLDELDGSGTQDRAQYATNKIPKKIIDIGCGTGRPVCESFVEGGHFVLGIDISGGMISAATTSVPGAMFLKSDMHSFFKSCPSESFDAATAYFSMAEGQSQADIKDSIQQTHRILKKGGAFIYAALPKDDDKNVQKWMDKLVECSHLPMKATLEWMGKVGFAVVEYSMEDYEPKVAEAGIADDGTKPTEIHLFIKAKKR